MTRDECEVVEHPRVGRKKFSFVKPCSSPTKTTFLVASPTKIAIAHAREEADTYFEKSGIKADLCPKQLREASGKTDLLEVSSIEVSVDTNEQSIAGIGILLPNLVQLRLVDSALGSFRDLGTNLSRLRSLTIPKASITHLDGIGALTALEELYLPDNKISEVGPIAMHETITLLDLTGNQIADCSQLDQLGTCPKLNNLQLDNNPIASIQWFRKIVHHYIPQMKLLDLQPLSNEDKNEISDEQIDEAISTFYSMTEDNQDLQLPAIDSPIRVIRQHHAFVSLKDNNGKENHMDEAASVLTHGSDVVFAGNPTSALRRRKGDIQKSPISITDTLDKANDMEYRSREDILSELKAWKLENTVAQMGGASSTRQKEHIHIRRPGTATISSRHIQGNEAENSRSPSQSPLKSSRVPLQLQHSKEVLEEGSLETSPVKRPSSAKPRLNLEILSPRMKPNGQPFTPRKNRTLYSSDDDENNDVGKDRNQNLSSSKKELLGIHFDLLEGLRAIDQWTENMESSSDEETIIHSERESFRDLDSF